MDINCKTKKAADNTTHKNSNYRSDYQIFTSANFILKRMCIYVFACVYMIVSPYMRSLVNIGTRACVCVPLKEYNYLLNPFNYVIIMKDKWPIYLR